MLILCSKNCMIQDAADLINDRKEDVVNKDVEQLLHSVNNKVRHKELEFRRKWQSLWEGKRKDQWRCSCILESIFIFNFIVHCDEI